MGWYFRRSKSFGPLRINLSKSGIGWSLGTRGLRIGRSATGRKSTNVSIPGTGIGYRKSGVGCLVLLVAIPVLLLLAIGCATSSAAVARRFPPLTERELLGTWALPDERNNTFNLRLMPGGRASSTFAYGPDGAKGVRAGWEIRDGQAIVTYEDGWREILRRGPYGIEKVSWTATADPDGPPTAFGSALKLDEPIVEFIGVWQVTSALPGNPIFHIALQSNRLAFKNIDEIRLGSCFYSIPERCVRIYWANGYADRIRRDRDAYVLETWLPGSDRMGPPDRTSPAVRTD
jgi:hypothetical protein